MLGHRHSLACIEIEGVGRRARPRCRLSGELLGTWWQKPLMDAGRQAACVHGMTVFLVDGSFIRNRFDSDFTQGSGLTCRFIPRRQIWLDWSLPRAEWPHLILHECCQAEKLRQGKSVAAAYEAAKRMEEANRRAHLQQGQPGRTRT